MMCLPIEHERDLPSGIGHCSAACSGCIGGLRCGAALALPIDSVRICTGIMTGILVDLVVVRSTRLEPLNNSLATAGLVSQEPLGVFARVGPATEFDRVPA